MRFIPNRYAAAFYSMEKRAMHCPARYFLVRRTCNWPSWSCSFSWKACCTSCTVVQLSMSLISGVNPGDRTRMLPASPITFFSTSVNLCLPSAVELSVKTELGRSLFCEWPWCSRRTLRDRPYCGNQPEFPHRSYPRPAWTQLLLPEAAFLYKSLIVCADTENRLIGWSILPAHLIRLIKRLRERPTPWWCKRFNVTPIDRTVPGPLRHLTRTSGQTVRDLSCAGSDIRKYWPGNPSFLHLGIHDFNPEIGIDSRVMRGFLSSTCGFTESLPFAPEHWGAYGYPYYLHSSGRGTALPQNTLSGDGCVVSSVAVNVSCHIADRVSLSAFSSRLGTGNNRGNNNNNNNNNNNFSCGMEKCLMHRKGDSVHPSVWDCAARAALLTKTPSLSLVRGIPLRNRR